MLIREFNEVMRGTPVYYPFFEVTRVPEWASRLVKKGDIGFYHMGAFTCNEHRLDLGASSLKFVGYFDREGNTLP